MKSDDAAVLREIQKNTEMGMKAIAAIAPRVEDDPFSRHLSRQELKYSEIHDKARRELLRGHAEEYRGSGFADLMLKGSVQANTLLNTSTSHIAGLMIQGSNRGLTEMWRALNHHENAGRTSVELAEELMDFEEKSIEELKKYL